MFTDEAPTKRDLRRVPDREFPAEADTKPVVVRSPLPARERTEVDFSRDPRRDPED